MVPSVQPLASRPADHWPTDPQSVPTETVVARVGAWRFVAMDGVPLIGRTGGGAADRLRRGFLGPCLSDADVYLPLADHARRIGAAWNRRLPSDFPPAFRDPARIGRYGTLNELVAAATVLLRVGLLVVDGIRRDAVTRSDLAASHRAREFIRGEEGAASRLYWPGNEESGVTIGPGYDMGHRSAERIIGDLTAVGVPAPAAARAAGAAGLRAAAAEAFAARHRDAVILTGMQQKQLMNQVLPQYEALVRDTLPASLRPRLFQHEFDALLSLAWNTRSYGDYEFNRDVGRLNMAGAGDSLLEIDGGLPGLVPRRDRESAMLTDAEYRIQEAGPPDASEYQDALRPGGPRAG